MSAHDKLRHIPTLDGWRAVAISLVLAHHAGVGLYADAVLYWQQDITRHGVMGVPIFFGISGLLITKLLLEEDDATGRISLPAFYIRRFFRIIPPLVAFLLGAIVLGLVRQRIEIAGALFFFRNYLSESMANRFTVHLWSLSVEEHFYLLWPLVLVLTLRGRRSLLWAVSLAAGFGLWRIADLKLGLIATYIPLLATAMRTDHRLDGLLWGAVAAILLHNGRIRMFLEHYYTKSVFFTSVILFIICVVVPSVRFSAIWTRMLIPWILLGTITNPRWLVSQLLDAAPIRWIGRISYSLYLWQQIFLTAGWHPHPLGWVEVLPWNLLASFGCATASYYLLERPLMRIGRRLGAKVSASGRSGPPVPDPVLGAITP